jgi:flagellar hook protein FlgE
MSLTSSLFSGVSGLAALGNSMTVIGDNIANVDTIGFKSSRVLFQDVLSQTVATQSGSAQVGRGTTLGDVTAAFDQGSFESTASPTDLAIGGEGFFIVRDPNNPESDFYTRAGSFRFDKNGNFVNPAGYIVKGWALARNSTTGDVEDVGSISDIKLANFTSPPEATDSIKVIANLNAQGKDSSVGLNALSSAWNGDSTLTSHIGDTAYEYQSTIKVYDSLGSTHDITIYFDRGVNDNEYEYIVTCDPAEDKRQIFNANTDAGHGLLGRGTLQFTSSGVLGNDAMTFERFIGDAGGGLTTAKTSWPGAAPPAVTGAYTGSAALPATYTLASATAGVIGTDAITVNATIGAVTTSFTIPANYAAGDYVVGPDGMRFQFTPGAASGTVAVGNAFTATVTAGNPNSLADPNSWADMAGTYTNQHFTFAPDFLGGTNTTMPVELNFGTAYNGANWVPDSLSTTQFSSASTTVYQTATGYGAGDLQSLSVAVDGAITGNYSNGQVTPLFRVALAKFQNSQGLFKEGGNLFRATRNSGERVTGKPGANGLGSISPNSLEQSNVDISSEFVKMITAQRGFQANSKIVTTVDQMLSDVIAMKR